MLKVIGIGPGRLEWLPPAIITSVRSCDVLIGGSRALALFPDFSGIRYTLSGSLGESINVIRNLLSENKNVGVLVSGDPGFFSLLSKLKEEFPEEELQVYPGISSLQLAFARAGLPWQKARFVSVHGRALTELPHVITHPTAVLTGGENTPQKIAQFYLERGFNPKISVGNYLAYPDEFWATMDGKQLACESKPLNNAVVILYPTTEAKKIPASFPKEKPCPESQENASENIREFRFGIDDDEFLRGKVPMTKAEIRIQILAKARLSANSYVADIGAGTGSISIEAAGIAGNGAVYAVEMNPEAQKLILANKKKFKVPNLHLIPGAAPDVFESLPPVDVCIIGGSNGRLTEIIKKVPLLAGGRIVITAVTIETVAHGLTVLKDLHYEDIDTISIQAVRWKAVHALHMAQALNPIFIISARKGEMK